MWLQEIWRYPVKSMAGEMLESAELTEHGVMGDRVIQVRNAVGRLVTARTRPLLLRHHAVLGSDGRVLVDGRRWSSDEVARDVEAAGGKGTRLVVSDPAERFDVLPLLITTDAMLQAAGFDRRRFRPNLVIGGVDGLLESAWEGGQLKIGGAVIGVQDVRARCIMTTFDPDSGAQDLGVLRTIQKEFNGMLGLNCYVIQPGRVAIGDAVAFVPES
jgi:uncharacterized protein